MKLTDLIKRGLMNSGGGAQALATTPNLSGYSTDRTTSSLLATNTGASTYTFERDTDSGFASPTEVQSGSSRTLNDTGLTEGQTYYYRVKGDNSDWSGTVTIRTISFNPEFWHEVAGVVTGTNNDYGIESVGIESLKSIINTSGPAANYVSAKWGSVPNNFSAAGKNLPSRGATNGSNKPLDLGSAVNFAGDFVFCFEIALNTTPVNHYIFSNKSNANQWLRFQSLSALQCRIGTSGVLGLTLSTALELGKIYKCVFKRVGTVGSFSIDGGATFDNWASSITSSTHTIDRLYDSSTAGGPLNCQMFRQMAYSGQLTTSQLSQFFNFTKGSTFVPRTVISSPSLQANYTTDIASGDYFGGSLLPHNSIGAYWRDRAIIKGQTCAILVSEQAASPDYGQDVIYAISKTAGKISAAIEMGVPYNNDDIHNSGGLEDGDNTIIHHEPNVHYDVGFATQLISKRFGDNYNLETFETLPNLNGVISTSTVNSMFLNQGNYHQGRLYNGKRYKIWHGISRYLFFGVSDDNGNNYTVYQIMDGGGATEFLYPQYIHSEDNIFRFCVVHRDENVNRYVESFLFKIDLDTLILSNLTGGHTITLDPNVVAITLATARSNSYHLLDTRADTGSARPSYILFDSALDLLYGFVGDGDDTGWQYFSSDGGDSALSFQAVDSDGETFVFDVDNDVQVAVLMSSATVGKFYGLRSNAGVWQVAVWSTDDGWATSSYDGVLSQDDTKKHTRITIPKNITYSTYKPLFAQRELDAGTNGDVLYIDATP